MSHMGVPMGAARSPLILVKPRRFGDDRGWLSETYSERSFAKVGVEARFVQDNHSFSGPVGTLRGLHYQSPPHCQGKLVRCVRGRIYDVAVDLRRGSRSYAEWLAVELTTAGGEQLYIPEGFAHGFVTLEPDTEVVYKVTDFYAPECDAGLRWDDPALGIPWPLPADGPHLSPKDAALPWLADFTSPFTFAPGDAPLGNVVEVTP